MINSRRHPSRQKHGEKQRSRENKKRDVKLKDERKGGSVSKVTPSGSGKEHRSFFDLLGCRKGLQQCGNFSKCYCFTCVQFQSTMSVHADKYNLLPFNGQIMNSFLQSEDGCESKNCVTSDCSCACSSKCLSPKRCLKFRRGGSQMALCAGGQHLAAKLLQLLARHLCGRALP